MSNPDADIELKEFIQQLRDSGLSFTAVEQMTSVGKLSVTLRAEIIQVTGQPSPISDDSRADKARD